MLLCYNKVMKYFFILGKNSTLSSAEIASVFENFKLEFFLLGCSSEVLLVEIKKSIDIRGLLLRLGGTIKIGVVTDELSKIEPEDIIKNFKITAEKKFYFGFSFYKLNEEISAQELKKKYQSVQKLGMEVKKFLKEKGCRGRWVTSREINLSSVVVEKNKLLTPFGAEIVFLFNQEKIYLGKTLAVQEFEEYSFRDFGRPKRDMRVGLMPPKLAKAMINFTQVDFNQVILDPFCGFGTILGEAMLLGYRNLIGSDINAKTLEGARQNLEWQKKNYQLSIINYQLLKSDVKDLSKKLSPQSVDAIVTEPYLGPPLKGSEIKEVLEKLLHEIKKLYLASFDVFKQILKKDGKIVIIFPVYVYNGQKIFLEILPEFEKLGFKITSPLPEIFTKCFAFKLTARGSILYSRPDQRVGREIFIFKRGA